MLTEDRAGVPETGFRSMVQAICQNDLSLSTSDRWEPEAGAWKLQLPMTLRLVTGGQGLFRVQMEAG